MAWQLEFPLSIELMLGEMASKENTSETGIKKNLNGEGCLKNGI